MDIELRKLYQIVIQSKMGKKKSKNIRKRKWQRMSKDKVKSSGEKNRQRERGNVRGSKQ